MTAVPAARRPAVLCGLALLALAPAGCATPPRPVSADAAAAIRRRCPEGTFVGAMTSNCPEIVK